MAEEPIETLAREIEEVLGHPLSTHEHLLIAVTHRSYVNESNSGEVTDNERYEFLGDAVLNLVVSDFLMERYPGEPEGMLSKYRSSIVNERRLATAARDMRLGTYLRLGKGEELTQGREKDSILADAFEAVIAAVYLSGGLSDAAAFVRGHLNEAIELAETEGPHQDFKTLLQERIQQKYRTTPVYRLVNEGGPDHSKVFESEVLIEDRVWGRGRAKSKKEAEQQSAQEALRLLQDESDGTDEPHSSKTSNEAP